MPYISFHNHKGSKTWRELISSRIVDFVEKDTCIAAVLHTTKVVINVESLIILPVSAYSKNQQQTRGQLAYLTAPKQFVRLVYVVVPTTKWPIKKLTHTKAANLEWTVLETIDQIQTGRRQPSEPPPKDCISSPTAKTKAPPNQCQSQGLQWYVYRTLAGNLL